MRTRAFGSRWGWAAALLLAAGCWQLGCTPEQEAQTEKNLEQAGRDLDRAGRQAGEALEKGTRELGQAVERGAEEVERQLGPVAREVLSDAAITARVKAKLIADPEVASFHIDVDTVDGQVTLNGKVASADQREEAEKLASRTQGVKRVNNLIQVTGASPPAG